MDQGIHRALYRSSPDDGSEVFVTDDLPVGGKAPDGGHTSATFAPFCDMGNAQISAEEVGQIAKKIHRKSGNRSITRSAISRACSTSRSRFYCLQLIPIPVNS